MIGLFFRAAGVDQPAAGAGDVIGQEADHQQADRRKDEQAVGDLVERDGVQKVHQFFSFLFLGMVCRESEA